MCVQRKVSEGIKAGRFFQRRTQPHSSCENRVADSAIHCGDVMSIFVLSGGYISAESIETGRSLQWRVLFFPEVSGAATIGVDGMKRANTHLFDEIIQSIEIGFHSFFALSRCCIQKLCLP